MLVVNVVELNFGFGFGFLQLGYSLSESSGLSAVHG